MSCVPPQQNERRLLWWVIGLTTVFEIMTCVGRFGFQLQSTRDLAPAVGHLTCGIRVHHSYIGAVGILVSCWLWNRRPKAAWWMLVIGLALFFSDLIHHFVILWLVVGSPQFDLTYPGGAF